MIRATILLISPAGVPEMWVRTDSPNCVATIFRIADTASELCVHQHRALGQKPVRIFQPGGAAGQFSSAGDPRGDPSPWLEVRFHGGCGRWIRREGKIFELHWKHVNTYINQTDNYGDLWVCLIMISVLRLIFAEPSKSCFYKRW